ncbi:MAG: response regulator [Zoogloeaceae bacterium]|jgi:two-component system chemotaxis response regulator CheY|nr:response regulator [Zoogloeaceae bacterium]
MAARTFSESLHILLVEPSSMQAQLVERMLQNLGVSRLKTVRSGNEALAEMRKARPDAVISSLYLPDMDGTALIFAMRADEDLEYVPFILISSETRPQALEPVRQSGACYIVSKPFDEKHLAQALVGVVDILEPEKKYSPEDMEEVRVLLVDDSVASRNHLRRMLNDLGIEHVQEASNGREAVNLLADTMVDLVLTDYNMPEMDGAALVEYIRTRSWQASVPILMITSESNESRLAAVEKAGVSAVFDKPFGARDMGEIVARLLADRENNA